MSSGRAILLSLALHALLAFGLSYMPHFEPPRPRPFVLELTAPTEQEKQDARRAEERGNKQVVRQTDVPDKAKAPKERPARFYSERDQAVLQETRAAASGLTQNRSADASNPRPGIPGLDARGGRGEESKGQGRKKLAQKNQTKQNPVNFKPESLLSPGAGDVVQGATHRTEPQTDAGGSRPLRLPNLARLGGLERGESTVGETLPSDIKFGTLTSLNTDRYVHYSFYARFEELFRHRWVKYVRAALFTYQNMGRRGRGEEAWTTRLEIVLDANGNFRRGILHDGSGFKALDAAPVEAMQEVERIPNPPAEMVQADGTVRLMYEFNVQFVPQYAGVD